MSLSSEAPLALQQPLTASRLFTDYAVEDLRCHPYPREEAKASPYFQASIGLAQAAKINRGMSPLDLASTPEMDYARQMIVDLPEVNNKTRFYRETLFQAHALMTGQHLQVPETFHRAVYSTTVEYATGVYNILQHVPAEKASQLKQALGRTLVLALAHRGGFAMSALPHQLIDPQRNPHAGILLGSNTTKLHASQRFAVNLKCGGYAEGHTATDPERTKRAHLHRVNLISACCDLRLINHEDGRKDMPFILQTLRRDLHRAITPDEDAKLNALSQQLIGAITDKSRHGIKPTARERRNKIVRK